MRLKWNDTERIGDRAALLKGVYAKPADARNSESEISLLHLRELALALWRHDLIGQGFHVVGAQWRQRKTPQVAIDAESGSASNLQVKIGRILLEHLSQRAAVIESGSDGFRFAVGRDLNHLDRL